MVARRYILELELWPLDIIILPMTGLSSRQEPKLTVLLQFIILFCERLLILRCKLDIFEKCQMGVPYKALHAGCVDIKLISLVRTLAFQNAFISLRRKLKKQRFIKFQSQNFVQTIVFSDLQLHKIRRFLPLFVPFPNADNYLAKSIQFNLLAWQLVCARGSSSRTLPDQMTKGISRRQIWSPYGIVRPVLVEQRCVYQTMACFCK